MEQKIQELIERAQRMARELGYPESIIPKIEKYFLDQLKANEK